jgi:hypothetical protein
MSLALMLDDSKASRLKRGLALVPSSLPLSAKGAAPPSLPGVTLGWSELEGVLPDGGLPQGVVELTSSSALGGGTRVALAAVQAAQARDGRGWCAWLDPEGSLYAPGARKAGVDLGRLLVVRPSRKDLARVAVKLAQARAFDVIVIDYSPPALVPVSHQEASRRRQRVIRPEVLVRKLALLAEEGAATIILLTDKTAPRPMPWPVALRLELGRAPGALLVTVTKDRLCRLGSARVVWPRAAR